MVAIADEIWINVDSNAGKQIVVEVCGRNEGHVGVWTACLQHAPDHTASIAKALRKLPDPPIRLGIVRRQYLRGLGR